MSAFWNKKEENKEDSKKDVKNLIKKASSSEKNKGKKSTKTNKVSADLKKKAEIVEKIILRPIISERAMNQQTLGKYVFEVKRSANKKIIAEAVKVLYSVDVLSVNLMNYKQKKRNFRNFKGKQRAFKKAIVSIKQGQEIKFFNE